MKIARILAACMCVLAVIISPAFVVGTSAVINVNSITALRALHPIQNPAAYLTQYNAATGMGGGFFYATGASSCSDDGGVLIQAVGGCYKRNTNSQPYNISWFGAQCGGQQVTDGVSSVSGGLTHTITSATATWTTAMIGWRVVVNKAASSGNQVDSTIVSVSPPGTLTYVATTGAANTGETVSVYPDDTTAIVNTLASAGFANSVTLPDGATCGVANPGSHTNLAFFGPSFYLNGGALWLGQTGPVTNTGVTFTPDYTNQTIVGPGTIDGLYQTNQGIAQAGTARGVAMQNNVGLAVNDGVIGNVIIQNTKGDCLLANSVRNFHITDLTVQNCGDFAYVPPMGDPEIGRSMGVLINQWSENLTIKGFTAIGVAQSGILISGSTDPNAHASITDAYFLGNGYYGLDVESNLGAIDWTNVSFQQSGSQVISRSFVYGGAIFLNNPVIHGTNITSNLIDSNALVLEESSPATGQGSKDWSLIGFSVKGTAANAGSIYIQMQSAGNGNPQKYTLADGTFDTLQFVTLSNSTCVAAAPTIQEFQFNNINASSNFVAGPDVSLNPAGAAGQFLYLMGSNSYLGRVNINSVGANNKALYFDWSKVYLRGAITFSGSATASIDASAIAALPGNNSPGNTSFSCP